MLNRRTLPVWLGAWIGFPKAGSAAAASERTPEALEEPIREAMAYPYHRPPICGDRRTVDEILKSWGEALPPSRAEGRRPR